MQRYFLDEAPQGETFWLPEEIAHHFLTVLRAREGEQAEFVLPDHKTVLVAKVADFADHTARMQITASHTPQVELPVETTLIIGLSKGDKPDFVVQKATELGVKHLIFVETDWSVVHWGNKSTKKLVRLEKIAQGASEQSHRLIVPTVSYAERLEDIRLPENMVGVVAWEESAKQGEQAKLAQTLSTLKTTDHFVGVIGPEGGLSEGELKTLTQRGFTPVGLGPRILRAETAPLYLLSALSYVLELS
ncbi:16S rRNA (uracil1498-N3)-methyltransferase [Weissella uvarum]|uniref:RsmE family RNA methyltransferase n=1 Tax=Weissella uvarum TaxID=1479233 RepID=UPI00195F97F1|nr:16S rRNA (uracil(1498)-N(3))-methyltransferase [Weissella uvarum]MBM7617799.1 16S rRNA (uracil1498-N3)-methyltransferase [Weissella uvarum]MCM0595822.1 16S rRNA (uracil(1498)-N(3))-methyltransferase [Weissella uvarum]